MKPGSLDSFNGLPFNLVGDLGKGESADFYGNKAFGLCHVQLFVRLGIFNAAMRPSISLPSLKVKIADVRMLVPVIHGAKVSRTTWPRLVRVVGVRILCM